LIVKVSDGLLTSLEERWFEFVEEANKGVLGERLILALDRFVDARL
jgi:hypothetical protein